MKSLIPLLALGALLVSPAGLQAKITRTIDKTFTVQPGGNLKASTQGGDINIKTADTPEVRIIVRQIIRASNDKEADELLEKLSLTLEQNGNDITAVAKYAERSFGFRFGNWPPVQVDFIVTLPRQFNADLQSSPADASGQVKAGLFKASINLDLNTSGGHITVASLQGNVRARTSGGNLHFDHIDGDLDGHTSGGDIVLTEGTARANLRTSGGDITIERASGPMDVSTSGGDVSVRVVEGAGFLLDASTSGGDVRAEGLPITIDRGGVGKSRLAGTVNGGGPRLKLHSSGGNITLRTD